MLPLSPERTNARWWNFSYHWYLYLLFIWRLSSLFHIQCLQLCPERVISHCSDTNLLLLYTDLKFETNNSRFWRRKYVKHKTVSNKNNCLDLLGKILEYFYDGYMMSQIRRLQLKLEKNIILIKTKKVLLLMVKSIGFYFWRLGQMFSLRRTFTLSSILDAFFFCPPLNIFPVSFYIY